MVDLYPFLAIFVVVGQFKSVQGASTSLPTSSSSLSSSAPSTTTTTTISVTPSLTSTTLSATATTGGNNSSVTTSTVATTTLNSSLACYDCTETFKRVWEPYTTCQYYPTSAPLRSCLGQERYCKVEEVSYREMTVSITRGCTDMCYHGCYAFGFGLTRLKCTSCCRSAGCNTGSAATRTYRPGSEIKLCGFAIVICYVFKYKPFHFLLFE